MIKEFVKKWDMNNIKLKEWFEKNHPENYEQIVLKLFELVINCDDNRHETFNLSEITVLDHGDYQGTQIFILHKKIYQPSIEDYVYTNTYYGSCSGCDTLEAIKGWDEKKPTESQVEDYMLLALHLLQKCKYMVDEVNNIHEEAR